MRKLYIITGILALAIYAQGQVSAPSNQSRVAGRFVAWNYGQWNFPIYSFPAGTGSKTFTLSNSTVQLGDGRVIMPFNTNAQVIVGSEKVTLTAIGSGCVINSTIVGGCSLTATFSQPHTSADRVSSATFGLQEALNDAGSSGGGAVTIDSAWANAGGTTGILSAATLPASTNIEDARQGPSIATATSSPSGNACSAGVPMLYYAGTYYGCDGTGHYAAVGGGGSSVPGTYNACSTLKCDDATDDTAAFNSLLSTVYAAGGGTIYMTAGKFALLNSAEITFPNTGASPTSSQPPIRITGIGSGSTNSSSGATPIINGGGGFDLRFNATHAKFVTLGVGKLEIDHLIMKDGGSDCAPFIYTTNTALNVHDVTFVGTASAASACNDVFILGGTTATPSNTTASPFQGYGTIIRDNFFSQIRRWAYGRVYANAISIHDNTNDLSTGNSLTDGSAIEFDSSSAGGAAGNNGNMVSNNTFEAFNYAHFVNCNNCTGSSFIGNGMYDNGAGWLSMYLMNNTALGGGKNVVVGSQNVTASVTGADTTTTFLGASSGIPSVLYDATITGALETLNATTLSFPNAGTVNSGGGNALTLQAGGGPGNAPIVVEATQLSLPGSAAMTFHITSGEIDLNTPNSIRLADAGGSNYIGIFPSSGDNQILSNGATDMIIGAANATLTYNPSASTIAQHAASTYFDTPQQPSCTGACTVALTSNTVVISITGNVTSLTLTGAVSGTNYRLIWSQPNPAFTVTGLPTGTWRGITAPAATNGTFAIQECYFWNTQAYCGTLSQN